MLAGCRLIFLPVDEPGVTCVIVPDACVTVTAVKVGSCIIAERVVPPLNDVPLHCSSITDPGLINIAPVSAAVRLALASPDGVLLNVRPCELTATAQQPAARPAGPMVALAVTL
jgi:hypothetical protein